VAVMVAKRRGMGRREVRRERERRCDLA